MPDQIYTGGRRSGRTTRMAEDIARTLVTSEKRVYVIIHDYGFKWYVRDLVEHQLFERCRLSPKLVDELMSRVRYVTPPDAHHRLCGVSEKEADIFTDHAAYGR